MAKIVIFNQVDPAIGITLNRVEEPPNVGDFWGTCTECPFAGQWSTERLAVERAQRHVDGHDPVMIGGDLDALVL